MTERPILFSAPMVRALQAGTKTQTRRIVKPDGKYRLDTICPTDGRPRCPYGQPGDRLWVRECFSGPRHQERHPPRDWHSTDQIHYWADGNPAHGDWTKPRPGMFMPRWASRITIEITDVRVERLQDISEEDARAEGVSPNQFERTAENWGGVLYRRLWEQINGPGSWDANPWVWVVSFKRVT